MTAGIPLPPAQVQQILTRLRKGVESHNQIAADQGLSRHTVHRIARVHGIPNQSARAALPPRGPERTDTSWMEQAKCLGRPWFTEMAVNAQVAECNQCDVREECLAYGLDGPIGWTKANEGPVYGGLSPRRLLRLQREMRKAS